MSQQLRLYQITDTAAPGKDKAVPGLYFSAKMQAKEKRQELNEEAGAELRYIVSPGPDHHKFKAV